MKQFFRYWGKTDDAGGYHLLPYHCLDVAAVSNALFTANPDLLNVIAKKLEITAEECRLLLLFFLTLHDLGKFSTSFQNLKPELLKHLQQLESNKQYTKRHDSLGYFCWNKHIRKNFVARFSGEMRTKEKRQLEFWFSLWGKWSTGHHGMPPEEECREILNYFRQEDLEAVDEFINQLIPLFNLDTSCDTFDELPNKVHLRQLSWLMAGLVTLCDWIGSNADFFPLNASEIPLDEYWKLTCTQADAAVHAVGIIPAKVAVSNSLHTLFPQYVSTATPLQSYCDRIEIPDEPQLWILEDVTGAGKTEAALILAGRMMSKGLGQGCFVALPTTATSNAMYDRMGKVYSKLFKPGESPSLLLAHGSRHLSEKFQKSFLDMDADNLTDNGEKGLSAAAQCSRWLADSSKKALLADVGVGTVDQVLLGILPARHQSLRLLGLKNKILIVDEVHSYDPYMNRLLENCLGFHAAAGGSAILLSATLSQGMRERLCNAYRNGLGCKNSEHLSSNKYPLVTTISAGIRARENEVKTRPSVKRSVAVKAIDEICDVYTLIQEETAKGRCICWIRNTVHDVRSGYSDLLAQGIKTDKLIMFHSRFALQDRLLIEEQVVQQFGSSSTVEDRNGQVLIASQVVEQSLDLDFDLMISDLAPIDLLIQRAGRLQRHEREESRDAPILYLYGPTPNKEPKKDWYESVFPKACYVYPDASNLWRTQQLLLQKGCISMPEGARYLIEGVYGEEAIEVPEPLRFSEEDYWGKEMSDRSMASFNGLILEKGFVRESSTHWDEETCIPTRLGDLQINLYLARIVNGKLEPFYKGSKFAWDQSKLKIREGLLETLNLTQNDEKVLKNFRNETTLFHKSDLIVPVSEIADKWVARGYDKHGNEMVVEYDCRQGLTIERYQQNEE